MTSPAVVQDRSLATSVAEYRVRSTRAALLAALAGSALVRAVAAALAVVAISALVDLAAGLPLGSRRWVRPLAIAAAVAALLATLWRGRQVRSLESVALWVEERIPWLNYSLVTLLDTRFAGSRAGLEPVVGEAQWGGIMAIALWRAVRLPLAIALVAGAALLLMPDGAASRSLAPRPGDSVDRPIVGPPRDPLSPIAAAVVPPAYSGLPEQALDEPHTIAALVGSAITVHGRGTGDVVRASADGIALPLRKAGDAWSVRFTMPSEAGALRLSANGRDRWVVLEPRADAAPVVRLLAPARDSVLRTPAGTLALSAQASDDLGLASGSFEVIVSSGQGESFSFRTLHLGARQLHRTPRSDLAATLSFDSLNLVPGDVLHIRAVARDANTVSGPGIGASETRAIRIARPGEYDSVAVEGAPPPEVDKSLLSQRMLIIAAERLHARRDAIERREMLSESRGIAADQTRLRQRVGELVFIRLEGEDTGEHAHGPGDGHAHGPDDLAAMTPDQLLAAAEAATAHDGSEPLDFAEGESPVVNVNRPLLEAYNAMWQAGSELEQGSPGRALPHMRSALDALQRARAAERVYLRGRPPEVVVDLADARLKGTERGSPALREPPSAGTDAAVQRARRFDRALELLPGAPGAAADSLLLLRIDALGSSPAFASALGEAIEALRTGTDATLPLARARRSLGDAPSARAELPDWSAGW